MVEYVRGSGLSSNEKEFPECADPFQEILPSAHPRTVPGLGVRSGRSYDLCVLLIGVSILQLRKLDRRCCKAGKEGLCVGPVQARTRVRACAQKHTDHAPIHARPSRALFCFPLYCQAAAPLATYTSHCPQRRGTYFLSCDHFPPKTLLWLQRPSLPCVSPPDWLSPQVHLSAHSLVPPSKPFFLLFLLIVFPLSLSQTGAPRRAAASLLGLGAS